MRELANELFKSVGLVCTVSYMTLMMKLPEKTFFIMFVGIMIVADIAGILLNEMLDHSRLAIRLSTLIKCT